MSEYLYEQLEQRFRDQIAVGQLRPGEKLPSVRQLRQESSLSKSTILTAYARLEAQGLIEARSRLGYFVSGAKHAGASLDKPDTSDPSDQPIAVSVGQVLVDIMEKGTAFDLLPAAASNPPEGNEVLRRCLARKVRRQSTLEQEYYDEPQGLLSLRAQLCQRMANGGSRVDPSTLVVTAGCQHALLLALMATTEPGDIVAIESPGFYGAFQLLEALGLKALELPCSVDTGVNVEALASALAQWPVKALILSPSFSTPTGACIPEANKRRILTLAKKYDIAVIEDDIYGELAFGLQRPRTLHSYDDAGLVLLCSSFSKCLSRDLRIGWIAPGKYLEKVKRLKVVTSLASSVTTQQGIHDYLADGGYDRFLRKQRHQNRSQYDELQGLIIRYLGMSVACSYPQGGLSLWLELPKCVDTLALFNQARQQGITIAPGRLFTAQEHYHNFIRLSFNHAWTEARKNALASLGKLIHTLM